MDTEQIAERIVTAYKSRVKTTLQFSKRDFKNPQFWSEILEFLEVPQGEAANWEEPEDIEITVSGVNTY